jgi:hypothetical protein
LNGKQVYFNVNFSLLLRLLEVDDIDVENIDFDSAFVINALRRTARTVNRCTSTSTSAF